MPWDDNEDEIVKEVKEEYKKAAFWLPFSALEINATFTDKELLDLEKLMKEVKQATNSNTQQSKVIKKYSGIVVKLLKLSNIIA